MCKFGRKFTSALLALALLVSLLPLGAAPAQAEGLTIKINSGSDLLYFIRDLGSGNEGYADANVVLTANISVGDFFPIGYYAPHSPVVPFTGTFDGNGHTISGNLVGIDNENFPVNKVGIIAVLGSAGIVKNLNVTCSVSGRVDGNVGGIVGENNGGTVTNCTFSGSVSGSGNVGGIVGQNNGGSVTDCTNSGGVSGKGNVGGVVGQNNSSVTNCSNNVGFGIWRISQSLNRPVLQENAQDGLPPGLGTEASPYRISTADELKSFRDIVNGEVGTVQITLAHDGEFGFTMTLSAPLGEENAGYWANLYHYDEEAEKLNFEAAAEIDEDGNVKIHSPTHHNTPSSSTTTATPPCPSARSLSTSHQMRGTRTPSNTPTTMA